MNRLDVLPSPVPSAPSPKPPPRRLRLDDLLAVTALLLLAGAGW